MEKPDGRWIRSFSKNQTLQVRNSVKRYTAITVSCAASENEYIIDNRVDRTLRCPIIFHRSRTVKRNDRHRHRHRQRHRHRHSHRDRDRHRHRRE